MSSTRPLSIIEPILRAFMAATEFSFEDLDETKGAGLPEGAGVYLILMETPRNADPLSGVNNWTRERVALYAGMSNGVRARFSGQHFRSLRRLMSSGHAGEAISTLRAGHIAVSAVEVRPNERSKIESELIRAVQPILNSTGFGSAYRDRPQTDPWTALGKLDAADVGPRLSELSSIVAPWIEQHPDLVEDFGANPPDEEVDVYDPDEATEAYLRSSSIEDLAKIYRVSPVEIAIDLVMAGVIRSADAKSLGVEEQPLNLG